MKKIEAGGNALEVVEKMKSNWLEDASKSVYAQ